MSGTFSSLSSALSAMRYNQTVMDVASGNVANASTTGYTRRQVIGQATGAPAVPAIWSRWDGAGSGVEASSINRMVDPLLDARARTEHASASYLDARSSSLSRLETAIGEPGDGGVANALTAFQSAWHDVANNPGDSAARVQLLARAQSLQSTVATQANAVGTEWSDQRVRLDAKATEVGQVAQQLADLNKGLRAAYIGGTDAGNLLDQRDVLTGRLAELTGATVTINADSTVDLKIGSAALVTGNTAATVTATGASTMAGAGADPVSFQVDGVDVPVTTGEVGATLALLHDDLPGYAAKLDAFVSQLVTAANTQHQAGVDLDGNPGGPLFSGTTAATFQVAETDPRRIAAADPAKGGLDNGNASVLATMDLGAGTYRNLVTSFGITVSTAQTASTNQAALTSQVDAARESVSGVNVDEEMVSLLAAQRGYEGAARVLTTLDSVLDTLINRTGLVGR
jgi:flagellar hook-associated protein 1 FlgK